MPAGKRENAGCAGILYIANLIERSTEEGLSWLYADKGERQSPGPVGLGRAPLASGWPGPSVASVCDGAVAAFWFEQAYAYRSHAVPPRPRGNWIVVALDPLLSVAGSGNLFLV